MLTECRPFVVDVGEAALNDLRRRLEATRWPFVIPGSGWDYGVELAYMKALVEYWRTAFDWREQQRAINRFAHFQAVVDGARIHFIHERGSGESPLPLVITHGWPGSFLEMLDVIPRLAHPERFGGDPRDAFEVVVPSLPGYAFSAPAAERGMDPKRIAELWVRLMAGLGFERFCAQGGDWGASVSTRIGLCFPGALMGLHLNYIPGSYRPFLGDGAQPLGKDEKAFLESAQNWYESEGAYAHAQATRPDTLAYALTDSPVGLLAWILEKLRDWSDCDGTVERRFSKDVILTHVTLYWVTGTIASANRLYYEAKRNPIQLAKGERVEAPCGIVTLAKEAPAAPRPWVERGYNVTRWTELPRGGHFAAMEEPELLVEDIRSFFRPLRGAVR
jgi:pimeloyl-ACP methyl ester carboxylesterase